MKGVLRNLPHNPNNYADNGKEKRQESKRQAKQEAQWPTIAISTAHLFLVRKLFALISG